MPLDSIGFQRPKRRPRRPTHRVSRPIHPSTGLEVVYRGQLESLLAAMQADISSAIMSQWVTRPPSTVLDRGAATEFMRDDQWLAMDDSSAAMLISTMRTLGAKWRDKFAEAAPRLARVFSAKVREHVDRTVGDILRQAGWTVRFVITPEVRDAAAATIGAQVDLIKSIAAEHLTSVQGSVMRSVMAGGDQGSLATALESDFGVAKRRAALIAKDQNRKATATITRLRQEESGIERAIWMHSGGGREPRPEHVEFSRGGLGGPVYDVAKGAYLANSGHSDRQWTWPGWNIHCRCVSRCLVPLSPDAAALAGLPPGRPTLRAE